MVIRIGKVKETGAVAFLHTCEICGGYAPFGVDVSFRLALNKIDSGKLDIAKTLLGKWYCLTHWKEL